MTAIAHALPSGTLGYREWGEPVPGVPTLVFLHGISSGSGSWDSLVSELPGRHVLAWDAPGYGVSKGFVTETPDALDYAGRLEEWLQSLGIRQCVLVGHSLGALVATAYVRRWPDRVRALVLADPARGYRHADAATRDRVYRSRWPVLADEGPVVYAEKRAPRLLCSSAPEARLDLVRTQMKRLDVEGFRRASWLLANDCLVDHLPLPAELPGSLLCGDQDVVTPPERVRELAREVDREYVQVPGAGHLSYIDNAPGFARFLTSVLDSVQMADRHQETT